VVRWVAGLLSLRLCGLVGRWSAEFEAVWSGGSLVCCDNCPASFHTYCVELPGPPDGTWYCSDCASGKRPHYGDIVWVKVGHYRSLILTYCRYFVIFVMDEVMPVLHSAHSLLPSARQNMSTGRSAVTLCSWAVKAGMAHYTCGKTCGWQVKLCDPSLTCAIPCHFRDEFLMTRCYANLCLVYFNLLVFLLVI